MVNFKDLEIPGVKLLELKRHHDNRGWLNETWRDSWNLSIETDIKFLQDMWSINNCAYTLRGLHALKESAAQYKLVTVLQGSVCDVVVDMRTNSPTYKKHLAIELSGDIPMSLLVPPGCYHGYLTLTDNVILGYKVDQYHNDKLDSGIVWSDPELDINWPLNGNVPIVSIKDSNLPTIDKL